MVVTVSAPVSTVGTPGVVSAFTPGLNPAAPPTVTVAILVATPPSGTNAFATINNTQAVAGTTTLNPATTTLSPGVSAITSVVTLLIGPSGSNTPAPPSTIVPGGTILSVAPVPISTITSTLSGSVITSTVSGIAVATTSADPSTSPTLTLAVVAVPATTLVSVSTGPVPVMTTVTIVSVKTGIVPTTQTVSLPASGWTSTIPLSTPTTLGLVGKVTSVVLGQTTQVVSLVQTPSTLHLLGLAAKATTTIPASALKMTTITSKLPTSKAGSSKLSTMTIKSSTVKVSSTKLTTKTSTIKTSPTNTSLGKPTSVLKTITGATKPTATTLPKKADASRAMMVASAGVGALALGVAAWLL